VALWPSRGVARSRQRGVRRFAASSLAGLWLVCVDEVVEQGERGFAASSLAGLWFVCVDEVVEQGEQGFAGGADVADVVGEVVELEGLEVLGE